jgi:hypothetical protein
MASSVVTWIANRVFREPDFDWRLVDVNEEVVDVHGRPRAGILLHRVKYGQPEYRLPTPQPH